MTHFSISHRLLFLFFWRFFSGLLLIDLNSELRKLVNVFFGSVFTFADTEFCKFSTIGILSQRLMLSCFFLTSVSSERLEKNLRITFFGFFSLVPVFGSEFILAGRVLEAWTFFSMMEVSSSRICCPCNLKGKGPFNSTLIINLRVPL